MTHLRKLHSPTIDTAWAKTKHVTKRFQTDTEPPDPQGNQRGQRVYRRIDEINTLAIHNFVKGVSWLCSRALKMPIKNGRTQGKRC